MGEANVADDIREAIERFQRETGIDTVILVGSRQGGTPDEHSDVDLVLVDSRFEGQKMFERAVGLRGAWPIRVPLDLICYTPEEFRALKEQPTIAREADRDGMAFA